MTLLLHSAHVSEPLNCEANRQPAGNSASLLQVHEVLRILLKHCGPGDTYLVFICRQKTPPLCQPCSGVFSARGLCARAVSPHQRTGTCLSVLLFRIKLYFLKCVIPSCKTHNKVHSLLPHCRVIQLHDATITQCIRLHRGGLTRAQQVF